VDTLNKLIISILAASAREARLFARSILEGKMRRKSTARQSQMFYIPPALCAGHQHGALIAHGFFIRILFGEVSVEVAQSAVSYLTQLSSLFTVF
jgi:hypothetical protein